MRPFTSVPEERETMIINPKRAKANISEDPNMSESLARGGERKSNVSPEAKAPTVEPKIDALKALVALPCCANAYPSRVVAADAAVPGILRTMAGIDPAYTPAFHMPKRKRMPVSAGKIKVNGRRMVIAAAAVNPGMAPKTMPTNTPNNMARRFIG
jgi:hypothetical protein